jgi:Flp pilus assembly protein TadD
MRRNNLGMPAYRLAPNRILVLTALTALLTAGGCIKRGETAADLTASIAAPPPSFTEEDWRRERGVWAARYERNPNDRIAALNYSRALRELGQKQQSNAILQKLAIANPKDMVVLGAYGKSLIDVGRLREAQEVLARAHSPERPNWRILSAQGVVADQLGDHEAAQGFYHGALKIEPNEPSLLANLGFSYALTKRLSEAEPLLRRAAAHPRADGRVRQNLVLVLGLLGKFEEAEEWARRDLPPIEAAQNIAYLRKVVSQPNAWKTLARGGKPAPTTPETKVPRPN